MNARAARRRRGKTAIAAITAILIASACSSTDTSTPRTTTTKAAAAPTTAAPAAPDCGNPVASRRPEGNLPAPGAMPAESEMAAIQQRGRLRVGVSADTLLFGARDPLTNRLDGFDIDMVRHVAAAIFGGDPTSPEIDDNIDFKVITYANRIPSIKEDDVDMVAHTMTINCRRWADIEFSSEYFSAGQKLLVRKPPPGSGETPKTIDQLDGAKVCAAEGSTNIDNLAKYPKVIPVPVTDLTDCLVLFQQSEVDAITGDDTVLAGFAKQDPYAVVVGEKFTEEPYGLGMSKDHPDLVRFVNGVIERMRTDGSWDDLYTKWVLPVVPGDVPAPPPAVYGR